MYFSVITAANNSVRQAALELAKLSPYAEHQWLWRFFPDHDGKLRDFIFRRHEAGSIPRFYVVSPHPPAAFNSAWQVQSRRYDPQLSQGQRLFFRLCANPVVTKKNAEGKSQRHDVVMQAKKQILLERGLHPDAAWADLPDDGHKPLLYEVVQNSCMAWLQSRAGKYGFEVFSAHADAYQQKQTEQQKQLDKQTQADRRKIKFSTVDFSGELAVTDPVLFQKVLFHGLGHAKAFGCGLLLVKRMEDE